MPADEPHESTSTPLGDVVEPERSFDQELGKAMGEAARKLQSGELSEAEFYEQFHEDVKAEFGRDDRPVASREED
jgi:molybdopterin-containing oxidoreductase family iron-sulfur binding subunit